MLKFIKTWTLPIAMIIGAMSYFVYISIPFLQPYRHLALHAIHVVQPLLIFSMLFVSFCKVDPTQFKFRRWHLWGLLTQLSLYGLMVAVLLLWPDMPGRVCVEGTMFCLICPTAAAAPVITQRLGGDMCGLITYTLLVNLLVAVAIPAVVPLVNPHPGQDFLTSFWMIMGKIFPMLICPLFAAIVVRYLFPAFHKRVTSTHNLSFYLWAISLSLALAVSTKSLMQSHASLGIVLGLAVGSLVACAVQFWAGHALGVKYGTPISASQALGQKNTVFLIWSCYTFLNPLSSIAGGFYSIWHNVRNTMQLREKERSQK